MTATASVSSIWSGHRVELCSHKVLAAGATMTAAAEHPDIINKIGFFHELQRTQTISNSALSIAWWLFTVFPGTPCFIEGRLHGPVGRDFRQRVTRFTFCGYFSS